MRRIIFISLITFCFYVGCVSDYDEVLSESEQIPVLNGVLYADSLLSINLTLSNHPKENEFSPIEDAVFQLKKNGVFISSSYIYSKDGTYLFTDTCFNGDNFNIEVEIPGFKTVSAKTVVPNKPFVTLVESNRKENKRASKIFELNIDSIGTEIHALYIFLFIGEPDSNGNIQWYQRNIYCNSPFADSFNRFYDSWAPEGFIYEYENFVRFPTDNLINNELKSGLAFIGGSEIARFYILASTKEYDLYYKGGYLQRSFDPEVNLPFTYQPIFLPSNINGGAGIFSGIDLSVFDFRKQ